MMYFEGVLYILRSTMLSRQSAGKTPPAPKFSLSYHIRINILAANLCMTYSSLVAQNVNNLDSDVSRSHEVKHIDGVGHPIYEFLFGLTVIHCLTRFLCKLKLWWG